MNASDYIHWVAFAFFAIFQFFSVAIFLENIIKKKQGSLTIEPAFFFFCGFLFFGIFNDYLNLMGAIICFILFFVFNLVLNTLNYQMTQSYKTDDGSK